MKKLLFFFGLFVSFSANAAMWSLEYQEYVAGSGWFCTYRLQGTNYVTTIVSSNVCQQYIFK